MAQRENVSPVTPLDRRSMQPHEQEHKPREIPHFQPPQQQSQDVTLGQRISNAITAVKEFFSFSDSLKGNEPRTAH